jgi:hypothetical protein
MYFPSTVSYTEYFRHSCDFLGVELSLLSASSDETVEVEKRQRTPSLD